MESQNIISSFYDSLDCQFKPKSCDSHDEIESFRFYKLHDFNTWELRFISDCINHLNSFEDSFVYSKREFTKESSYWKISINIFDMAI